jgi:hypothetical protein
MASQETEIPAQPPEGEHEAAGLDLPPVPTPRLAGTPLSQVAKIDPLLWDLYVTLPKARIAA